MFKLRSELATSFAVVLLGAGFYVDSDSSTLALTLSSETPPKAGDTWTIDVDKGGVCDLSFQQDATATLWKASAVPAIGSVSVTFISATLMHGTSNPDDVYYVFDLTFTATLEGETEGAPEVTVTGSYKTTMLPLGA